MNTQAMSVRVAATFLAREQARSKSGILREIRNIHEWEGSGIVRTFHLPLKNDKVATFGIVKAPEGMWATVRVSRGSSPGDRWFVNPDGTASSSVHAATVYDSPREAAEAVAAHAETLIQSIGLPDEDHAEPIWKRWFGQKP